jgi:lantibiotic biosynthesis protein
MRACVLIDHTLAWGLKKSMSTLIESRACLRDAGRTTFAQLRQSAITSSGMATWMQRSPATTATVGPSVYSGTSGIAWALAEYARWSDECWAGDLAIQAINHALTNYEEIPVDQRLGFYSGWSGIVFSAVHVADLLDEPSVRLKLAPVLAALAAQPPSHEFDLVSGAAGAIFTCSILGPDLGPEGVDIAFKAAVHLRTTAQIKGRRDELQAAWLPSRHRRCLPQIGLAHGAAGVAWSLLELWARRPEESWLRELAEQAFAYEDGVFNPIEGNWPDLRHYATWRAVRLLPAPYQCAWCHGAGGIALSRLRAYEITGKPAFADVARTAGHTLNRSVDRSDLDASSLNLCHGPPGNAEISTILSQRLTHDTSHSDTRQLAAPIASTLLAHFEMPGSAGIEPGLMLGIAGLGLYLIRASGAQAISPLYPSERTSGGVGAAIGL